MRYTRDMRRLLLTIVLASACATLPARPLRMGGFVVAPLIMGEPGKPLQGALRDYLEREGVAREVPLQWMPVTSLPQAYDALRTGALDVVLLASGSAIRKPGAAPFSWTYLLTQPHVAVRPDSPLHEVSSLNQLSGMAIGWVAGPRLSSGLERSGARWHLVDDADWQMVNLRQLQAGSLAAVYFENEYSPRYAAHAAGIPIRLVKLPMPPRYFFMLYSLKADPAAIGRFDRAAGAAFAGRRFRDYLERYAAGGEGGAR
jgi:polar amino acid transport system substrate-binding protein